MTKPLILAATLLAAVVAGAAPPAQASPAALQQATNTCWLDVINDWLDNNQVDKTYAIPCYTQAIQHLSALPDVTGYSSAIDDIHRALLAAIRQDRNQGPGAGSSGGTQGPNGGPTKGGGGPSGTSGGHHSFFGIGNPSSATSVPLPLIVLGALAILLALAALATWLARRFQARRPAPAPAIAKRR